jgi:hypothetical protein
MAYLDDLRDQARGLLQGILDDKEPRREIIPALMGDIEGTCEVDGREAWSWVRPFHLDSQRMEAWNGGRVRNEAGIPVQVEILLREGQSPSAIILGVGYHGDLGPWERSRDSIAYLPKHGDDHEARPGSGSDVTNVYKRAITELRADAIDPASMQVVVRAGLWYYGAVGKYFEGSGSPTFTAPGSGSGYRWDLLYLKADNLLAIKQGSSTGPQVGLISRPDPEPNTLPIAYVLMHDTTTVITDDLIYDARQVASQVLSDLVGETARWGSDAVQDGPLWNAGYWN